MCLIPEEGLVKIGGRDVYVEKITRNYYTLTFIKELLYRDKSKYQLIEIVDTEDYGKILYLDGKLQVAEADEWIYHETLVHPAMLTHPEPKRVIIIGGGDGGALREVLKHPSVEEVELVELDPKVVDVVTKYMPEIPSGAFEDDRVKICYCDGRQRLKNGDGKYDVIICDVTDPMDQSAALYTREFYSVTSRRLAEKGILVTQAVSTFYYRNQFAMIYRALQRVYRIIRPAYAFVPSFGDTWAFINASNVLDPANMDMEEVRRRFEERRLKTRFYTPEIHSLLLYTPKHLRSFLEKAGEESTDEHPAELKI